ncbi:hypothetical protein DID96_13670 [Burkholderia sp. Bp8963]|uniref:hypothetical protein n=1 Tax=Burkholderia sp. Bp8963 TaxID=2184547 RepID=UPI000F5B6CDF|nr:hypothetical protein [Burkholderia sp. Bp8963]RQS71232.1 hypothetical protein DID96_13670 [Burkholderia sp. Bp8963]
MSRNARAVKRPSLAQLFDAPDAYLGHFGWLCGYSADAAFLDDAAERFTGQTHARRAAGGRIALAMMLDPGNSLITTVDVPGLMHLPLLKRVPRPFRLLHAKVAVLGFRHQTDASRWRLRVIVSTGNWTRQTLEESLDLAWSIDVASDALDHGDDEVKTACADVRAAWRMIERLAPHFDTRIFTAIGDALPGESAHADGQLRRWIALCEQAAGRARARFVDNWDKPLLTQLPALAERATGGAACNRLAMGSGFFESMSADAGGAPPALLKIIGELKRAGRITQNCQIDVFVNPDACQAVAQSVTALAEHGVTVRRARTPEAVFGAAAGGQRTLHAKFLFAANERGSNACTSAWLYLGSGNLTKPGFLSSANTRGGNLEAGVVFAAEPLQWEARRGVPPEQVVGNVLPVHRGESVDTDHVLTPGGDMPERPDECIASPIAWLTWRGADAAEPASLRPSETMDGLLHVAVLDPAGAPCARLADGFAWPGERPRQVEVRWADADGAGSAGSTTVPVLDEYGRVAATPLTSLDVEDLWWQLASFPMAPDDDAPDRFGEGFDPMLSGAHALPSADGRTYPIRQMMELIENIAQRQTAIDEADWHAWCSRLEQTLVRAAGSAGVTAFAELELNPLSPLRAAPFRPGFAETGGNAAGARYEAALRTIEQAWAVGALPALRSMR